MCFNTAVELSTSYVELLRNVYKRDLSLHHVVGHRFTKLSNECVVSVACEHSNITDW